MPSEVIYEARVPEFVVESLDQSIQSYLESETWEAIQGFDVLLDAINYADEWQKNYPGRKYRVVKISDVG